MDSLVTLTADRSHLFPGAVLAIDEPLGPGSVDAAVVFGDGSTSEATLSVDDSHEYVLAMEPYRTAAGTPLPAKTWLLRVASPAELRVTSSL